MPADARQVTSRPPVALLDALRAVTSFAPPPVLPDCDLAVLGDVLEAHGLAALASRQLESTRLGASVPEEFRERLLTSFQGVVNDNLQRRLPKCARRGAGLVTGREQPGIHGRPE